MFVRCLIYKKNDLQARNKCFLFRSRCCRMRQNMLPNSLSSKFTDISGTLGSSDTILRRELRGHIFSINQSVYSVSGSAEQSFGRITERHQQGGKKKITLFSALANSIFLLRLCKMDMIRFAGSSSCYSSLWPSGFMCSWFSQTALVLFFSPANHFSLTSPYSLPQ